MPDAAEYARQARYRYRPGSRCDHDTTVRFYSTDDRVLFCDGCGQPNRFLYACTADTPDFSPVDPRRSVPSTLEAMFSPEMQRNIAAGHYTEEQVQKLVNQKINVQKCIEADLEKAFGVPRSTTNEEAIMQLQRQSVRDWLVWMRNQEGTIPNGGIMASVADYIAYMPCQLRMCAVCQEQRNMAQKSFGSIDAVLNDPGASHLPIPEYLSRPVVSGHVAANLPEGSEVQSDSTPSSSTVTQVAPAQMAEPEQTELTGLGLEGLQELSSLDGLEEELEGLSTGEDTDDAGDVVN